ncbi:MAG: AAA family ATPase [Candidatus Eremiobacteraeota bacterium]|nr:AAA family ATPase [Candidatus Eremiobacteraeota bacterium]
MARTTYPVLDVHLLGPLALAYDGVPHRFAAPPKTAPVLAYLLLHRAAPVAREGAAFALWPDENEEDARANLRRHLHYLRSALPAVSEERPWVLGDKKSVQWNPAVPLDLDVAQFEALSAGREYEPASRLYRGDLLEGMDEEWLLNERERLRTLQRENLRALAATARARGDLKAAALHLEHLLAFDPWSEDAVRDGMEVRYLLDDRAGALADFERFARRLSDEMGVEPMAETAALYERIVRREPLLAETVFEPLYDFNRTPFVGRVTELQRLLHALAQARAGRRRVTLIGGEAGVGKSRLARVFADRVSESGGFVFEGTTSAPEARPYESFRSLLGAALQNVQAAALGKAVFTTLAHAFPELPLHAAPRRSSRPADGERERERLFEAVFEALVTLAEARPLLAIIEDIHWAGDSTIAMFESIARRGTRSPLLVLGTYREEEVGRHHPLRAARRRLLRDGLLTDVTLNPLSARDVHELVTRLFRFEAEREALAHRLYDQSEGNALFLIEILRAYLETGRVLIADGRWTIADDSAPAGRAPAESIIRERIGRLPAAPRSVAEFGSVLGRAFDIELLCDLSGWSEAAVLDSTSALVDRHIFRDAAGRARDFTFSHQLLAEAVYRSISEADRRRLHRRAAAIMSERSDPLGDRSELAHHYLLAGEKELAAQEYAAAARRALELYAYGDAVEDATRALGSTTDVSLRAALLLIREEARRRRGEHALALSDLDELEKLFSTDGDAEMAFELGRRRAILCDASGDRERQAAAVARLSSLAEASGKPGHLAAAAFSEGELLRPLARYAEALSAYERSLEAYSFANDTRGQLDALFALTLTSEGMGRYGEASARLAEARRLTEQVDDPALQLKVARQAAYVANSSDDYETMEANSLEMLRLARTLGDRFHEALAQSCLGSTAGYRFDIRESRAHFESAETMFDWLGSPWRAVVTCNRGELAVRLGLFDEALSHLGRVLVPTTGTRVTREAHILMAETHRRKGDRRAARTLISRVIEMAPQPSKSLWEARSIEGRIHLDEGELQPAIDCFRRACDGFKESISDGYLQNVVHYALALARAGEMNEARHIGLAAYPLFRQHESSIGEPQLVLWILAQALRLVKEAEMADRCLLQALRTVEERLAKIPDEPTRIAFANMSFDRDIVAAAHDHALSVAPS